MSLAAVVIVLACGTSSGTGPKGSSHAYAIDITANFKSGNICEWAATDRASILVSMTGLTGTVSHIVNSEEALTQTRCNGTCTEVVVSQSHGPIAIDNITAVGEQPQTRQVTVSFTGMVGNAQFQDNCAGQITTVGGGQSEIPSYLTFLDNGLSQDYQYTDPATGQSFHEVVTPK